MNFEKLFFILFLLVGVLFVLGSLLELRTLIMWSNFLLVPVLLLFFVIKTTWPFLPIMAALLLFYIRDVFMFYGFLDHGFIIGICYFLAMSLLFLCVITSFKRVRMHPFEVICFFIMYGFLMYLFISLQEAVDQFSPANKIAVSIYLLLLMLLVALSFTAYLMKSHLGSLWFLIAASAFLVSEVSLFFKVFIIEDISVNFFYPFFHVVAYYAMAEYGLRRWRTGRLRFF